MHSVCVCLEEILQYRREKRDIPPSIARERVKPNTGFRRIPFSVNLADAKILHRPRLRLFILNLPRRGGNRGTSLPCNFRSLSSPSRLRHSLRPGAAPHNDTPLVLSNPSQQPAATHSRPSSSIIYHFEKSKMLLSARVCSKNFIRSPSGPSPAPPFSPR